MKYSAENHDWDLTLSAAGNLLMIGHALKDVPTTSTIRAQPFSCYVGSMLLSFSAIESFSASVAFSMPRVDRYRGFDYAKYRKASRFWVKIDMLCEAIEYVPDKSQGMFQFIGEMQNWRNLVTHSSPYRIEETTVANSTDASSKLHKPFHDKEYTRRVNLENATKFYLTAGEYIALLTKLSGMGPRATHSSGPDTAR